MAVRVSETIAGLSALAARVNEAAQRIASDGAEEFQRNIRIEAPIGTPGNTTNPPGDLAASVRITGPVGGGGVYTAEIGPTTIYARQRELGGAIYPQVAPILVFTKFGETIFASRVYQQPNPYTKRGYEQTIPLLRSMAVRHMAAAIVGR